MIDRDDVLNSDYDFYDVLTLIDKVAELEKQLGTVKSRSNQAHSYLNSVTEYFNKHDKGGNYYKNLGECEDLLAIRDLEHTRQGFWLGFEDARCHPDEMNILQQWEGTKRFNQAKALKEQE
jgi:hypothetical protein